MTTLTAAILCASLALASSNTCPELPTTYYALAGSLNTWTGQTNIDGGMQFTDINGDGLAEMLYAYGNDPSAFSFSCVYLNTGYAWVLQNTTDETPSCSRSSTLIVRDTELSFKQHTVEQFRQAVAAEFGLGLNTVHVRNMRGVKQGLSTRMADLMTRGFELTILVPGAKRESYTCL